MENVLFLNRKTPESAEVNRLSTNLMQIIADCATNISGFNLLTDAGDVYGKYEDYTTLYREIEGGFILSNDGSVYVEPEPVPDPEPYVPTLEEVQEAKVNEMNVKQQEIIAAGIDVQLSDGTTEHFTLTQYDQQSLMGLQSQVLAGAEQIPWHNSNEEEHCKFYSNADMQLIVTKALAYVTYHVTYFRDLRIYIRTLTEKEVVLTVTYGVEIPEEFKSDVIKAMEVNV